MARQGARNSVSSVVPVVLALVFPAIIGLAVAKHVLVEVFLMGSGIHRTPR